MLLLFLIMSIAQKHAHRKLISQHAKTLFTGAQRLNNLLLAVNLRIKSAQSFDGPSLAVDLRFKFPLAVVLRDNTLMEAVAFFLP